MVDEKYDVLKMYFGEDFHVTDKIIVKCPTIGQIIEYGETKFWTMVSYLCANPTSLRLELWEQGIDWNDITDFQLFMMLSQGLDVESTSIILGNLDLSKLKPIPIDSKPSENDEEVEEKFILVYDCDDINDELYGCTIDEDTYNKMVGYLRLLFNIHPKVEKAANKSTKELMIDDDKITLKMNERKKKKNKYNESTLFPLISAALNHSGFKYKKSELKEVGIFEFMDAIQRLRIIDSCVSFNTGMYMGMMDTKKLDLNKELNWARDLYDE